MNNHQVSRLDIAGAIHNEIGLSRGESMDLLNSVFSHISEALEKGEDVKLSGFGVFTIHDKNQRQGRNPRTGAIVPVTERRVVTFKASAKIKKRMERLTRKILSA